MATKKTTSDKLTLSAEKRTVFGKKLNALRRQGNIPANVFGPEFASQSLTVKLKEFAGVYKVAKETGVIYLQLDKAEIPTLVAHVQRHPVYDLILHVDLRKIDLKKKVEANVPVNTTGTSEAVSQKGGVLLRGAESLKVEALPTDIPQEILVDISSLKELGQEIKVADLPKSTVYEIKEVPERVVVSVVEHKEESVTPETTSAAPEITTAAPVEGEAAAEGQAPAGAPAAKEADKAAPAPTAKEPEKKK